MIDTQEHYDLMEMFEHDYRHLNLDKEAKEMWRKGQIYANGETNNLFKAYRMGYSFARSVNNLEEPISELKKTERGFSRLDFDDANGKKCSLQKSSSAVEPQIWLGIDDPKPTMMANKIVPGATGWCDFPLPDGVEIFGRMHLTREKVKMLLPYLTGFAKTGELE